MTLCRSPRRRRRLGRRTRRSARPTAPECAELNARDLAELEDAAEQLLAQHDAHCIAEAIQDAYDLGHDDPDGIRFVAAQGIEDGHSPCRCAPAIDIGNAT
jgi:hypothetical protein